MTPEDVMLDVFDRAAVLQGKPALLTDSDLAQWPDEAVAALKAQKIITRAGPATTAVCPGCERECLMPVEIIPSGMGNSANFVVCDKRSDTGRVDIPHGSLVQWQSTTGILAEFVATALSIRFSGKHHADLLEVGYYSGNKRNQMLCLRAGDELMLVAGSGDRPLADVMLFSHGRYTLDVDSIRQFVDASTTSDSRYTPSNARRESAKLDTAAMYDQWQKAYRQLKKSDPGMRDTWYAAKIAKMPIAQGRSAGTIRKWMTK